jgi:hypothetical protein
MTVRTIGPAGTREIVWAARTLDGLPQGLAMMLLVAVAVAACGTAAVGPVDHECHGNPARSQGSGCEDYP